MSLAISSLTQRPERERYLGKFQLLKPLGHGGFASVWLAREMLGESELRQVAIKLFTVGAAEGDGTASASDSKRREAQQTIIEEVRALCRVEHPNVVRFYGIVADDELGVVGLVMELLAGSTLAEDLELFVTLDRKEVVDLGQQLAWALTAVHRAGLVHRDIKPGNIMHERERGRYRLIDLGIASRQAERLSVGSSIQLPDLPARAKSTKAHTQFSYIRELSGSAAAAARAPTANTSAIGDGTLGYVDPRSFVGPPTIQSDLYSLGATLYECLTGYVPAAAALAKLHGVDGGLRGAVLDGREAPPSVAEFRDDLPRALVQLVDSLLSPNPSNRPPSAEAVAWLLERIQAEEATRGHKLPPEGPFRGLGRFESGDRTVLFGRSTELAASLEMLRTRGMLALVGPSGSGKSSLARAGIVPSVEEGRLGSWPKRWEAITVEPGDSPRERIGRALERFVPKAPKLDADALLTELQQWVRKDETGVLLLVDQLEELVTHHEVAEHDRRWVARLLGALGNAPNAGICTVVGARQDLLGPLLDETELGRLLPRCMLHISPLTRETWGEVIDQALGAYGFRIEDEALRTKLLNDIGKAPMPLIQFALSQLWERRDKARKVIPWSALEQIGGIAGALNSHAESIRDQLRKRDSALDGVLRRVLIDLTTPEGTRRARSQQELEGVGPPAGVRTVITALTNSRILERDGTHFGLSHEALIDQWQSLRTWISETKSERRLLSDLEHDAEAWSAQKDGTLLWRGPRLLEATSLSKAAQHPICPSAKHFLDAANRHDQRSKLVKRSGIGFGVIAAILMAVAYAQFQAGQRNLAEEQSRKEAAARGAADRARADAEAATQRAVKAEEIATQEKTKAARAAAEYNAALSALEARLKTAENDAELRKIRAEIRTKLGAGNVGRVNPVSASATDATFGTAP